MCRTARGYANSQAASSLHRGTCDIIPTRLLLTSIYIPYERAAMADAMDVDVPAAEPKGKTKEDGKAGKKRFEVKKVRPLAIALVLVFLCCLC